MNVRQLIQRLHNYDGDRPVQIATCERKNEWYEVADIEATTNDDGFPIVVINTD